MKQQQAPGQLEIVRTFINTLDLEAGTDDFATPTGMRCWLARHLPAAPSTIDESDRRRVVDFRELLRAAASANGPTSPSIDWLATLNRLADNTPLQLRFGDALTPHLATSNGGRDAVFTQLLWIVAVAAIDGTWKRLKVCPAEDCRWAFYDNAKNRMGVWCQMAECGNRRKARAHRARQHSAPAEGQSDRST
ncbi:CGNR zinc finger domain-containing protein [Frankia sp. CiP3]|uniref:CGNR zinc finger domain-containing protein n=1 Tax=Frankia sp. CiP3 TaxID=2880971 RepID=UPI001EF4B75F|nr:CGNR zinc finger domain-containing protein [Frankia sp. CiP3]